MLAQIFFVCDNNCICIYVLSYLKTGVSAVTALLQKNTYITSATIRSTSIGVVTGWQDINHCVAAQLQIRAIHEQPYPVGSIPCETWERGQTVAQDACTDIGNLFRPFKTSVV
jgi:hypothetical protein